MITNSHINEVIEKKFLNRITSVEYVISEKCQNSCKYCYRVKKHNQSSVICIDSDKVDLFTRNLLEMFDLSKKYLQKLGAELFGGDGLLDYQKSKDIIDLLYYRYRYQYISIPTNARMINELTEHDIIDLICDKHKNKMKAFLSLSVDGDPVEKQQRPLSKFGQMLAYSEDIDYTRLQKLSAKYKMGFHPMFSFDNVSAWYNTFLFFDKLGCHPYLLEVRHPIDNTSIFECVEQLSYIKSYVRKKYGSSENENKVFNTINPSRVPRGLGCSALTTLCIMPNGDLTFCHRLTDPPWVHGNVLEKKYDVVKSINYKAGYHHSNHPVCIKCPIRHLCSGLCAGANYEYWGDPWTPIPSICDYYLCKTFIFYKLFEDWRAAVDQCVGKKMPYLQRQVEEIFGKNKQLVDEFGCLDNYIEYLKQKNAELSND